MYRCVLYMYIYIWFLCMNAVYAQIHMDILLKPELEAVVTKGRALKVPFITLATKEPSCHAARQHKASRGKWIS